jgi:O-6-methylguanine DNA methyltransferase
MFYTILDFPLGKILLAKSEKGLSLASSLKNQNRFEEITEFFKRKSILLELQRKEFHREEKLFSQYFEGKKEDFTSLPLDFISGTPYQRKVWLETRKIPYGKTQTYKFIAEKLNHRGYRSIGQALSQNPLLIVIPCHRVLSSDGGIGGFTGGLDLKKFLLRLEKP